MEDSDIIVLYERRDEEAIRQTELQHGTFCRRLAGNFLRDLRDVEECLSDTWLAAWNQIPPEKPLCLRAFLGRITRNLAVSRYRRNQAVKRGSGLETVLDELEEALPGADLQQQLEQKELSRVISQWLDDLPREDRILFVRRYWMGESVKDLAAFAGETPNRMARKMQRLRQSLRRRLEQEGESVP